MDERDRNERVYMVRLISEKLEKMGIQVTADYLLDEVPVSVSGRHLHLCRVHMDILFGKGSELTLLKKISQPNQFASKELVTVEGPKGKIDNLRVLGPLRKETQVELASSDARRIGLTLPIRASGNLDGSPGIKIVGPKGDVVIDKGCIIAERHIHMTPEQAAQRNVTDGQEIKVAIDSVRGGILEHVHIHVRDDFAYDMHIDSDEANALGVSNGIRGRLII